MPVRSGRPFRGPDSFPRRSQLLLLPGESGGGQWSATVGREGALTFASGSQSACGPRAGLSPWAQHRVGSGWAQAEGLTQPLAGVCWDTGKQLWRKSLGTCRSSSLVGESWDRTKRFSNIPLKAPPQPALLNIIIYWYYRRKKRLQFPKMERSGAYLQSNFSTDSGWINGNRLGRSTSRTTWTRELGACAGGTGSAGAAWATLSCKTP